MTVKLSTQLQKAISPWVKEYGYDTTQDFVEDAIQHRLLELKKGQFLEQTKTVKKALYKHNLTEADIIKDFTKSRS